MLLSLVIPVFNEELMIRPLLSALRSVLHTMDCSYEILFVNDGSRDGTTRSIESEGLLDSSVRLISFGRNFGHQAAITAGLDFAMGDAIVVMDADLQDPPEVLVTMLEKYREGYDVVSAQRSSRTTDSFFKRTSAGLFYWLLRHAVDERILPEVGDFRLFSRAALLAIRGFREQHRFMRGLVAWLGLKEAVVRFERQPRFAGETKYPLYKMLKFAWTAISSFSALPLRLTIAFGSLLALIGLGYFAVEIGALMMGRSFVRGWTSIIALQCLFSGATFFAIGMIGDYVGRIYEECKQRPLYVVTDTFNIGGAEPQIDRATVLRKYQTPARSAAGASR